VKERLQMQKILFVENGRLDEVNKALSNGWKLVSIHTVSNHVASSGDEVIVSEGNVFAYIVLEK
jgi:hypothetical protein